MASLVFVSTGGSCFKPSLIRPIKQQGNRGKDITSNYAMFIIDQKIASAKRLSQKQHVSVYSLPCFCFRRIRGVQIEVQRLEQRSNILLQRAGEE